ncbi:hypothetical protein HXX76_011356 [Chlamydomonas incerta]|uniref:Glycosyltransferase family 92 protein n=1 Tax=Chlamydomonas incerta TaxID=51695 RepID=A0A835VXG0_CHLIN|nr:hypothetical protein HXX76_011356 [Chlamydomonas incerta]|eukprot:KAG2428651.1 hypothetical protein HXX76_011356 [Chlamydomonas incerta]
MGRFGVEKLQLYARAPIGSGEDEVQSEKVLLLQIWLKRITVPAADEEPRFLLPGQQPAIHGLAWADDFDNNVTIWDGVTVMTVDPNRWHPDLRLELESGEVLEGIAIFNASAETKPGSQTHPFDFTFPLPTGGHGVGHCFKLWEASFPDNKAPFCLPPSSAALCHRLAPPAAATPSSPALWAVLSPLRKPPHLAWQGHVAATASRLTYFLTYLLSVGGSGLLSYADPLTSQALERSPHIQRFLREGRLLFVTWDMMERRTYNYDHQIVYNHVLLGLSGCGTNLWLQFLDLDEMLFSAYGSRWSDMYACLAASARARAAAAAAPSAASAAATFKLHRVDILSGAVGPDDEAGLWAAPPRSGAPHPLTKYDRIARRPHPLWYGKFLAAPAYRFIHAIVHYAEPTLGAWYEGNATCAFVLHVRNYWRVRSHDTPTEFEPLKLLARQAQALVRVAGNEALGDNGNGGTSGRMRRH